MWSMHATKNLSMDLKNEMWGTYRQLTEEESMKFRKDMVRIGLGLAAQLVILVMTLYEGWRFMTYGLYRVPLIWLGVYN